MFKADIPVAQTIVIIVGFEHRVLLALSSYLPQLLSLTVWKNAVEQSREAWELG